MDFWMKVNFDEDQILALLADIQKVIEESNCTNVLIASDMNTDFDRKTRFTEIVQESLTELGVVILWQVPDDDPQHLIRLHIYV